MNTSLNDVQLRPVLDLTTATTIGQVEGAVIDYPNQAVSALVVGKTGDNRSILPFADLHSLGADAVTIDGTDALRLPHTTIEERTADGTYSPVGKRALTELGLDVGVVTDAVIDAETGAFVGLVVGEQAVEAALVMAVGDHAAVIRVPDV